MFIDSFNIRIISYRIEVAEGNEYCDKKCRQENSLYGEIRKDCFRDFIINIYTLFFINSMYRKNKNCL